MHTRQLLSDAEAVLAHLRGSLRGHLERGAVQGAGLEARLQRRFDRRQSQTVSLEQADTKHAGSDHA